MNRRTLLRCLLAALACGPVPARAGGSRFHAVYGDPVARDAFYDFLKTVFRLYPEDRFHQLIVDAVALHDSDEAIYRAIATGLDAIRPLAGPLTHGLPALARQKRTLAEQAARLIAGDVVHGYLEIGSTGRYVRPLSRRVVMQGPVFLCNDIAPTDGFVDVVEREQLEPIGSFIPLGDYDPLPDSIVDGSLSVVSCFIGFHHCPPGRLDGFLASVRRVLRGGGLLLLREHDVHGGERDAFVAVAHDVFNAGVGLSWEDNAAQVRAFRSVRGWTRFVEAAGFSVRGEALAQRYDPTDNLLLAFEKV